MSYSTESCWFLLNLFGTTRLVVQMSSLFPGLYLTTIKVESTIAMVSIDRPNNRTSDQ